MAVTYMEGFDDYGAEGMIDQELLAILLWDHFGDCLPRRASSIARGVPVGTVEQCDRYRRCAASIAQQLERSQQPSNRS